MKYSRRRDYARTLGVRLADRLPHLPADTVVVPVPTAAARVRSRGFDQAAVMAKSLASHSRFGYRDILARDSQADLIGKTRRQRLSIMEGSFSLKTTNVPKNILLVDDVITTGATLESAARLLRDNGAKHVDAATAAH